MATPSTRPPPPRVGFFGWLKRLLALLLLALLGALGLWYWQGEHEKEILRQIVSRLTAEQRVAEVVVEDLVPGPDGRPTQLTLKILELDPSGKPLEPRRCTFTKNDVIHFEALVVRLDDRLVMEGEGHSVHLFRRAFALSPQDNTYEACDINRPDEVPGGYALKSTDRAVSETEARFWRTFWELALDEERRQQAGVKNAQIEAPATRFVPEMVYRLVLEADGGLTIQASPVPAILKTDRPRLETVPGPEAPRPAPAP
jgi:hypothetical protein